MTPLSERCLYLISTRIPYRLGPLESFSIKLAMFKFLRELFDESIYWYVPLIFISEVISEPHLMSCSSQISCYIGPKRLFSGKSRYPLSLICLLSGAFYRTNGWSFSKGTEFPIWCFCSPERKESENCCLPLGYWIQSKLKLCGFLLSELPSYKYE